MESSKEEKNSFTADYKAIVTNLMLLNGKDSTIYRAVNQ